MEATGTPAAVQNLSETVVNGGRVQSRKQKDRTTHAEGCPGSWFAMANAPGRDQSMWNQMGMLKRMKNEAGENDRD